MRRKFVLLVLMITALIMAAQQSRETLTNASILRMRTMGFPEEMIIHAIDNSPGAYDTSVDGLLLLKRATVSENVIAAIVQKGTLSSPSTPVRSSLTPTAHSGGSNYERRNGTKPRVFLKAKSHSDSWTASRNQSMVMSKDFGDVCPGIQLSINHELSDYTVSLNHTEHGFYRDNQLQVVNRAGDVISGTKEGGSIMSRVKDACADIVADWEGN